MKYDFAAKQRYRVKLWTAIDRRCTKPKALRRVVYLDTGAALETMHLLNLGYRASNLLAVNRSPAHVARLTQTLKQHGLERVQTRGADWLVAVREFAAQGPIDVANFDGTGVLDLELVDLLRATALLFPKVLAVSILGGREAPFMGYLIDLLLKTPHIMSASRAGDGQVVNERHKARLVALLMLLAAPNERGACVMHLNDSTWGSYQSASGQPMVWGVVRVRPHEDKPARRMPKGVIIPRDLSPGGLDLFPPCMNAGWCTRLQQIVADIRTCATARYAMQREQVSVRRQEQQA